MELLNQLDGFDDLGRVKIIMATNRWESRDPGSEEDNGWFTIDYSPRNLTEI